MGETLPPFPAIRVAVDSDVTAGSRCDEGFLRVRRRKLVLDFPDGSRSAPFAYDEAWRVNLDAVTVAVHFRDASGVRHVFLRSAVRPPVSLRPPEVVPPVSTGGGSLWELPAGLVEADERTPEGLVACAAREVEEELGFTLDTARVRPLGRGMFPTPGVIGERIYFFETEVDPGAQRAPSEDGSALEKGAAIVAIPATSALDLVRGGLIEDMKTEVGLRRLLELP